MLTYPHSGSEESVAVERIAVSCRRVVPVRYDWTR